MRFVGKYIPILFIVAIRVQSVLAIDEIGIPTSTSTETDKVIVTIDNPLNATSVEGLIDSAISFLGWIAGSLLVVAVLVGAFQIMASGGNPDRLKSGRNTIIWALIGFAIVLVAGGFGSLISNLLGGPVDPSATTTPISTASGVVGLVDTIARWMFGILMALGVVFILYSAFLYLTSRGDVEKVDTARRTLVYAIVAMVIGVLAGGADLLVRNALNSPDTGTSGSGGNSCVEKCIEAWEGFGSVDRTEYCESAGCNWIPPL